MAVSGLDWKCHPERTVYAGAANCGWDTGGWRGMPWLNSLGRPDLANATAEHVTSRSCNQVGDIPGLQSFR